MTELHIELANIAPTDGRTPIRPICELWEEVAGRFRDEATHVTPWGTGPVAEIRVDALDVLDFLRAVEACEVDPEPFHRRMEQQLSLQRHALGSRMTLHVTHSESGPHAEDLTMHAAGKFLQQLYLGMNLAVPGAFSAPFASYPDHVDSHHVPPRMSASSLEDALTLSRSRGWPAIARLDFGQVWSWLRQELPYGMNLAEQPHHRALMTLLRISDPDRYEADTILHIAQALEGFFADGKEGLGSIIRRRLELILGRPSSHANWFKKLYDRRSRIAHGTFPISRPGNYYHEEDQAMAAYASEFMAPVTEAVAVLIALVQDLISNNAREYVFVQEVLRPPR